MYASVSPNAFHVLQQSTTSGAEVKRNKEKVANARSWQNPRMKADLRLSKALTNRHISARYLFRNCYGSMAVHGDAGANRSLLVIGALVLAHSLRDAGTAKKLAILVTLDSVSAEVITQLKASRARCARVHATWCGCMCLSTNVRVATAIPQSVYDYVIPVSRVRNDRSNNLSLMNRPDLHSAFTKISLWRQTQFRKIVYIDADVVAYRAPDELFDLPYAFAAAPDIGWPDIFNTGVMVLTPNQGDYYALTALAERGVSFDGADQGLLNMYFQNNHHRLSFNYNVTPSAHYQYTPAYMHFQSSINMVHFIGNDKPWLQGRKSMTGNAPYDEIVGRWWAVYDRHYRKEVSCRQGNDMHSTGLTDSCARLQQTPPQILS